MFSKEYDRKEIAALLGKKGKELTAEIRAQKRTGRLISRRVFIDPAHSNARKTVFQFVAVNMELPV